MKKLLALAAAALVGNGACNCDEVLDSRSVEAELFFVEEETTPPLEQLEVGVGALQIGTQQDLTFTLDSVGSLPVTVQGVALGADPRLCPVPSTEFTLVGAPPPSSTVKSGERVPVVVRFKPTTGAVACVALTILTDDATNPVLTAIITGQGDAAALCTERGIIDFGDVVVGTTADDVVALRSCGTRPVTVAGVQSNEFFPPFAVDGALATLPATLAPGDVVELPVHFAPVAPGRHSVELGNAGALTFQTDLEQLFQVMLIGNGKAPPQCALDAVPAVLNFGFVQASQSETSPIILRNVGELDCNVAAVGLRDAGDEFSFTSGFVPGVTTTLAPFEQLQVDVTFSAPDVEGAVDNALIVDSDDLDDPTLTIPIQGQVPGDSGCFVDVTPGSVDFGAVQVNTLRAREVVVSNVGEDPCFIDDTAIGAGSDDGFVDVSSDFGMIFPGNSKTLTVGYRPLQPSLGAHGTLEVTVTDSLFGGTPTTLTVPLSAFTGDPGICVTPLELAFGDVQAPTNMTFTVSACGAATVTVSGLPFTQPDSEFTLVNAPALPRTLTPGDSFIVTVRYSPVDEGGDTGIVTVVSDDFVSPEIDVRLTGGHEIVPPEAGRYLYYWSIPSSSLVGAGVGGDVMRMPLQGDTTPRSFWGPRHEPEANGCAGCHSVSPDGKYIAVVEVGAMRFVEADTNLELFIGGTALLDPTSFSWRPNVATNPPYQYVYSDGLDIRKGSLFDGDLGVLNGANSGEIDTMPSWGRDGVIAFVRGVNGAAADSNFGIAGETDIMLIDEDGGTATPVQGASGNGAANYYPFFSPNGLWVAFTQSQAAQSTVGAADATIQMFSAANNGTIIDLAPLNSAGPNSYTTWSVDGQFLSFSSKRSGGQGNWDVYLAGIDPLSGGSSFLGPISELNTADFEHAVQWSP